MITRKIKNFTLFVVLPLLMSCESCENKLFHFSIPFPVPQTFNVDQNGAFSEIVTITAADILNALDIPEDSRITGVEIRSLNLQPVVKEGNQASAVLVTGQISEQGVNNLAFQNFLLPLPVNEIVQFTVSNLIEAGINAIKGKIEGFIMGLDNQSFVIELSGDSTPTTGQRIVVDLTLTIEGTIQYDQCVDVWDFLSIAEDCDIP